MTWNEEIKKVLEDKASVVKKDLPRSDMIRSSVEGRETIISASGALATWTPPESTGRSPKDTVIVKRKSSEANIDWDSPNNIPITEETFDMAFEDGLALLKKKE
ncbi:MAG: phosphoenolpyruvate carboxykinase (ATP), partial [bacterium]